MAKKTISMGRGHDASAHRSSSDHTEGIERISSEDVTVSQQRITVETAHDSPSRRPAAGSVQERGIGFDDDDDFDAPSLPVVRGDASAADHPTDGDEIAPVEENEPFHATGGSETFTDDDDPADESFSGEPEAVPYESVPSPTPSSDGADRPKLTVGSLWNSPAVCGLKSEMKRGILTENPVLRLVLGTCPTLAVTTAASNAIGMGVAATLVLICSNTVISLLRRVIPDKVRIPAYITVIASFVSVVQMLVKAYAPALDESLGIYLPLIVVNCIILGRAEMYASKHEPAAAALDGLAMGVGFTAALLCMGIVRELLGAGSVFGHSLVSGEGFLQPILFFAMAPGGFFVFGLLIAAANRLSRENNLPVRTGCGDCPAAATCSMSDRRGQRS